MTDKSRQRPSNAPKGYLPNWALAVGMVLAIGLIALAQTLV